jgi:putative hydrolase of the HAD superfamily
MRKDIEAVAFDLDGTLYPNYRLNIKLIPFFLKEWRLLIAFGRARNIIRREQKTSPDFPLADFYHHQAAITAGFLRLPPEPVKERIDRLMYRGWMPFFRKINPFPHAAQTLVALRAAGYKLGLLSDFPPETKLEYLGLSGIWDAILCSERYGVLKPHARSFRELAAALALPPEKILYVGNSFHYDVAGANREGMKTAWITPCGRKRPGTDFIFSDYRQLHNFMLT